MTSIENITAELSRLLDGESAPSFRSPEAAAFLRAVSELSFPSDHARLGASVLELMIARLKATAAAERELAMLQDGARLS